MVKLRKIQIAGFRGARFPLLVDFEKSSESMAIFGENAAGKSSITDAVEWFFNDRIEHLWREDCKEASLRNIHLPDSENATVSIDFSNNVLSCVKSLNKALKFQETNTTSAFKEYKAKSSAERIVLRTTDLNRLADESKGDKRKRIAEIIGYEALVEFRDLIQKTENNLQNEDDYIHAKKSQEEARTKLLKLSGEILSTASELFRKANELANPFALSTVIIDDKTYAGCIDELTKRISNKEAAKKQHKLSALKQICESIAQALVVEERSSEQFLEPYTELIADKERSSFSTSGRFSQGKDLIDKGQVESINAHFAAWREIWFISVRK
jgi:hypothetical protein